MSTDTPTYAARAAAAPSPMVLTKSELLREAEALVLRLARDKSLRDCELVMALAARLKGAK